MIFRRYKEKLDFINNVAGKNLESMEPLIFLRFFFLPGLLSLSDCTPVSETILGSNGFCHLIYPEAITRSVSGKKDTLDKLYNIFFVLDRNLQAYGGNKKD